MATGGDNDVERGTDETFDFLCSVCSGKNKNTEAEKFCYDCHDYYCSSCVKFHEDIPVLKNHQILDKAQFGSSVKSLAVPTERCKLHKHKPVDMYCKNHDVVACSACMLVEHSICKDKFYFIKNSNNMPNSTDIAEQLDTIAKRLSVLQKTFITEEEKLKRSKEKSIKQIETFRRKINQRLHELEKSTINELDRRFHSLHDKIASDLKELQAATTDLLAAQDCLKSTGGNNAQKFVSVKTAQAIVALAQVKTDTITSQLSSTEISFVANQKLKSLLHGIHVLGEIILTEKQLSQPPSYDSAEVSDSQTNQKTYERQSISSLIQIKGSKKYNMKVNFDKGICNILSACILKDGTIILSSANIKLKRVDPSSFIVRDGCDVPAYPCQVCAISNTEVAVCCSWSQLIQFVTVGRTMTKTRQINTGNDSCGLAYADRKLFVSDDYSVYVYNVTGDKLQQFVLGELGTSRLAVSSDNLNIYVTSYNKGLIILDRNGSTIGGFNGPELRTACDVALHSSGDILVCGSVSKNILQFSPNGKLIGEVLKSDKCCQTINCDKKNSKLIVGFIDDYDDDDDADDDDGADEIEVYDISM